jgi:hypothetical protein
VIDVDVVILGCAALKMEAAVANASVWLVVSRQNSKSGSF